VRGFRADAAHFRSPARPVPDLSPQSAPSHLPHQLPAEGVWVVRDRLRPGRQKRGKGSGQGRRQGLRKGVERDVGRQERHQDRDRQREQGPQQGWEQVRGKGRSQLTARRVVVGTDTGGTFTDFVALIDGRLAVLKLRSTPDDPARAVAEGVRRLSGGAAPLLHYGSTVATNALLERRGARVVLLTTL